MGDAADDATESGQAYWWAHLRGECEGECPYCADEEPGEDEREAVESQWDDDGEED